MENLLVPYQATKKITGNRVLVFAPHPDDEVFGCGGAIMLHVEQQIPVRVIIVTNGSYGISPEKESDYIHQRQQESIIAASILGYGNPVFWQYRDRELYYGEKLIAEIINAIHETKADLVYTPSVYEIHPDHRALGMAVIEAVRRCANTIQLALYEIGQPIRPNLLLDISDLATRKMEAMGCFTSQNAKQRYDLDIAALNRYRTYTLPTEVTAAEAYLLTNTEELAGDPLQLYQSEHARQQKKRFTLDPEDLPLVSVIIRSMDRPTLSDALDSVALQTYPIIEVILVHAKGQEHSTVGNWCGRFPLREKLSAEPLHRSAAANNGLDAAKGDYLIFLDDDDWFMPHHIARLKMELDRYHSAVAAYSAIQCIDESGKEVNRYADDFDPIQLRIENYIPIHAALFKRTVLDKGARFDEKLSLCEDWDFWLQVMENGEFRFVSEVGAIYSTVKGQGSGIRENKVDTQQAMITIYKKWMPRWNDEVIWRIFEYARLKKKFEKQQKEVIRQKQEIIALNEKITAFVSSSSWRITHPLRVFRRFFNRSG